MSEHEQEYALHGTMESGMWFTHYHKTLESAMREVWANRMNYIETNRIIAPDGTEYDRDAIQQWLDAHDGIRH